MAKRTCVDRVNRFVHLLGLALLWPSVLFCYHVEVVPAEISGNGIDCSGYAWYANPGSGLTVLKQSQSSISYAINPEGTPDLSMDEVKKAIDDAFSLWQSASGGVLTFKRIDWSSPSPCPSDKVIRLSWTKDHNVVSDAQAITYPTYDRQTGEILGVNIFFNQTTIRGRTVTWRTDEKVENDFQHYVLKEVFLDVQTNATHEIGHALGLGHSDELNDLSTGKRQIVVTSSSAVMAASKPRVFRTLQNDDIEGINSLYPPPTPIVTFGSVEVTATLNGAPWVGPLEYLVICPFRLVFGHNVTNTTSNMPTGLCYFAYVSGGPATTFGPSVSPSRLQILHTNETVLFEVDFKTTNSPPTAAFTMSVGTQTIPNTQALNLTVPPGGTATVLLDGGSPNNSSDQDGSVTWWNWSVDGKPASTDPAFPYVFVKGSHEVRLVVTDNAGSNSVPATGIVIVTETINTPPTGSLDGVNGLNQVFGWSKDPDDPTAAVIVHLYIDKNAGTPGAVPIPIIANQFRSDVGNHAFNWDIPSSLRDGQQHTVWAWGIDLTDPINNNALLPGSSKTFTISSGTAPTCTISASPSTINQGQSSTLTWTTTGSPTSASINGVSVNLAQNSTSVSATASTTYTMTMTNAAGNGQCSTTVSVNAPADLNLSMAAAPDPVASGANITYLLTIQNTGGSAAQNVVVNDNLPGSATFVSCTTSLGTCSNSSGIVTAQLGTLAASASAMITIVVRSPNVTTSTTLTNSASVSTTSPESNTSNNQASVTITVNPLAPGATGSMNTPRQSFAATVLNNGLVLVTGGTTSATATGFELNSAELYDPQTGTWRYTGIGQQTFMTIQRRDHSATKLNDGRVLIAGGAAGSNSLSSAEIFDPATETFTPTGFMLGAHDVLSATLLNDGRVLAVGTFSGSTAAEIYNPATGTWSISHPDLGHRPYSALTLLSNGTVLMVGGWSTTRVDLFDPATNTWRSMAPLRSFRGMHSATALPNGKVLVAGGNDGSVPVYTSEIYDPAAGVNGSSVPGPIVLTAGWGSSSAKLLNGNVVLAGGQLSNCGLWFSRRTVLLYDSATGTISNLPNMNTRRSYFQMVLLSSGKVLAAGGADWAGTSVTTQTSAEILNSSP